VQLTIDPQFTNLGMAMNVGMLDYAVNVDASDEGLFATMREAMSLRIDELMGEAASSDPVIANIREAFKKTGKDPSRYRPSSEAITRRVLSGKGISSINNVVDCGNLVSLMTGIPVGCYDADKIIGDITLRIGEKDEKYEGLGRGDINLEGLPVLCDNQGPFGTPFSDSVRTPVGPECNKMIFILYGLNIDIEHVEAAAEIADTLITSFCINNTDEA
jgi:DNA/RNA-binding domain of Phe-tRNA-synthetase-like protein